MIGQYDFREIRQQLGQGTSSFGRQALGNDRSGEHDGLHPRIRGIVGGIWSIAVACFRGLAPKSVTLESLRILYRLLACALPSNLEDSNEPGFYGLPWKKLCRDPLNFFDALSKLSHAAKAAELAAPPSFAAVPPTPGLGAWRRGAEYEATNCITALVTLLASKNVMKL